MGADHYIYCYFRPNGTPCYIGKGRNGRWKQHLTNSTNQHLRNIIAKAGGEIPHVKLHVGLTNAQATTYEIALIKAIGRKPNGPLVNLTDGGEGAPGCVHSQATIAKRVAAIKGKKCSETTKQKIAAAHLGKTYSDEHRASISEALTGRKISPEALAKRTKHSEEHRAKLSESIREWWKLRKAS